MKGRHQEQVERLRQAGYVTRDEAAEITGRASGGTNHDLYCKHGVASVAIPMGNGGRECRMYLRDDLANVPKANEANVPGGEDNGGRLMREIKDLRSDVTLLQDKVENLLEWRREYGD